jgi:hypothetical protein
MNPKAIWQYILARGQEPTTWRGLILIATALGAKLNPVHVEAIVTAGLFLAGIVAVSVPEKPRPKPPKEPPHDDGTASDGQ